MSKILVLNVDASPITVMSFERGFRLAYIGKADVVAHVEDNPIMCDISDENYLELIEQCPTLLTTEGKFKRPTIIRLNNYVVTPYKKVTLSRENIYKRDNYSCVYCGSGKNLTIDHVIPKSKGGKNSWDNLVTCCGKCNLKKGDKDLEVFLVENDLTMCHKPYKPSYMEFLTKYKNITKGWEDYVML